MNILQYEYLISKIGFYEAPGLSTQDTSIVVIYVISVKCRIFLKP